MQENRFVLDCSVSAYWFAEYGPETHIAYARKVESSLSTHIAVVPSLWQIEMLNVLLTCERKGKLTHAEMITFLKKSESLPIMIDDSFRNEVLYLGIKFSLTAYDATYLSLALHKDLPLATLDQPLIKVAKKAGVEIYQI